MKKNKLYKFLITFKVNGKKQTLGCNTISEKSRALRMMERANKPRSGYGNKYTEIKVLGVNEQLANLAKRKAPTNGRQAPKKQGRKNESITDLQPDMLMPKSRRCIISAEYAPSKTRVHKKLQVKNEIKSTKTNTARNGYKVVITGLSGLIKSREKLLVDEFLR